ncbi:LAMI_0E08592g1_1 [Lachancea mirantina]|uniref:E3 ubiquitin-protein ligase listerin n=1 Tax=Lachancea mirantina TaxID=1230905 RepID=A0A1G4JN91_9SACH|nr:LAMI_0E08592g1_1 [Lachancea mirantina]
MSFGVNTLQLYSDDFGLGSNGVQISLNYFSGIPEQHLLNSLASSESKVIFKSLHKRDETTKEKALNELLELIDRANLGQSSCDDDIFTLCWSQMYAKLVTSDSRNLRTNCHQLTCKLIKLRGKKITKFLPDLIPLLLSGSHDYDAVVAKATYSQLLWCFNDDQDKISKLWVLFESAILKLVKEIVLHENEGTLSDERYVSHEDSRFKYIRLLTTGTCMLTNMIVNDKEKRLTGNETYEEILSSENLWQNFSFKYMNNVKTLSSLLTLARGLSKSGFLSSNHSILKLVTKRILKSLAQLRKESAMHFSSIFPQISITLAELGSIENGLAWTFVKKSDEKIFHFLELGPCSSGGLYYKALFQLYEIGNLTFDYEQQWHQVWKIDLSKELMRKQIVRGGDCPATEFWRCYFRFCEDAPRNSQETSRIAVLEGIVAQLESRNVEDLPGLKMLLANYLSFRYIHSHIGRILEGAINENQSASILLQNLLTLMLSKPQNEVAVHAIAEKVSGSIEQYKDKSPALLFTALLMIMKEDFNFLTSLVKKLLEKVIDFTEKHFFKLPAALFIQFSKSHYVHTSQEIEWLDLFDKFASKLVSLGLSPVQTYQIFDQFQERVASALGRNSRTLREFFTKCITSGDSDSNESLLLCSKMLSEDILKQMLEESLRRGKIAEFCTQFLSIDKHMRGLFYQNAKVLPSMVEQSDEKVVDKLLNDALFFCKSNNHIASNMMEAILSRVLLTKKHFSSFWVQLTLKLIARNNEAFNVLFPSNVNSFLNTHIPELGYNIALANNLGFTARLLSPSEVPFNLHKVREGIVYALFLHTLVQAAPDLLNDTLLICFTVFSELAMDYNTLSAEPEDFLQEFELTLFRNKSNEINARDLFKCINGDIVPSSEILENLVAMEGCQKSAFFYRCVIVHKLLNNSLDFLTTTEFDREFDLMPYVRKVLRSDVDSRERVLASAVISSFEKFRNKSQQTERLRTFLASELIGVRDAELSRQVPLILTLLNSLLAVDDHGESKDHSVTPIAPQRLRLIFNQVSDWLDGPIYEFYPLRITLLDFLSRLFDYPSLLSFGHSLEENAVRLLDDSLNVCLVPDFFQELELKSYCIRFYSKIDALTRKGTLAGTKWLEDKSITEQTLIDLLTLSLDFSLPNAVSNCFYKSAWKICDSIPIPLFRKNLSFYIEACSQKQDVNIDQIRLLTVISRKIILLNQQDALIEYELKKGKEADGEQEDDLFHLPGELLEALKFKIPQDSLPYANGAKFLRYLWCLYLTLSYFKDISYNFRQNYIDQLKHNGLIDRVLRFFAEEVSSADSKFWASISDSDVEHYHIITTERFSGDEDLRMESKKLLAHLMFLSFNILGSLVSAWYLNIKDRALQTEIDKFVCKHITPILVKQELQEAAEKVKKLTSSDSSLSIKIINASNEIKAGYLVDEQKLEIVFKIPVNYPLTNVQVLGQSRVGIDEHKWKSWILSTQRVITGMNGSIMDSLELFTRNVNLHFSGFEECAICYSILHAVDHKLPTKTCPTCSNRFHGACLYKWFRSSGNNTCPLCRAEIPFRK